MPLRVTFFTNATSDLSLPVLRAFHAAADVEVAHVFMFDTIAASKGRLFSVMREHGAKKTIAKVLHLGFKKLSGYLKSPATDAEPKTSLDYSKHAGISHSVVRSVNSAAVVEHAMNLQADVLVCCSFSQIMRAGILATAKSAAINIHPSLLPRYRGPLPSFWALNYGEEFSGVSFHLMQRGIDTGDIVKQFSLPIESGWDEDELNRQLFALAAENAVDVLQGFAEGRYQPYPQNESESSYYSFPTPSERRAARSRAAKNHAAKRRDC